MRQNYKIEVIGSELKNATVLYVVNYPTINKIVNVFWDNSKLPSTDYFIGAWKPKINPNEIEVKF